MGITTNYRPDDVWAKGTSPVRPKTLYMRLTSELLPDPEKPTKRIVPTGGISIDSLLIPPVGTQKSPERYARSLCRISLSPSGAITANLSSSLNSLNLGERVDTLSKFSFILMKLSNSAPVLHQQYTSLDDSYSSSSDEDSWVFIFSFSLQQCTDTSKTEGTVWLVGEQFGSPALIALL